MSRPGSGRWVVVIAALALTAGMVMAPRLTTAQDLASPVAGEHNHPAHIHTGTCDAVGEVIFPLNNVASASADASPVAEMVAASPEADADFVAESTTTITGSLDDLLAADHVVNVHESAENIGNYITCGLITGAPENGELTLTLTQLNESGWDGEAVLTDNGDGTIDVTVRLKAAAVDATASPEASPAA
ncbi:MAG: hypothetical protein IT335_12385 [Thermomicrobiales bacterium]|nr:hypothetical protein [Thermomicrobiales bacterium]